ncbi:Protein export cytoplasm protein SecA ATPase RNA helicase [gamma proteobacterium IMCC2047]|nr:Protein export cytoplasm protein SecA ATPase RNA helicase [gamma proteobacterium IMCC2047]
MLQTLDTLWKEHLSTMDHLRQGIGLRSYAAKNPKQEYKREAFALFEGFLSNLKHDVARILSHLQIREESDVEAMERQRQESAEQDMQYKHDDASAIAGSTDAEAPAGESSAPFVRDGAKVGRNDPCPCGSGKKYKQCCGSLSKTA